MDPGGPGCVSDSAAPGFGAFSNCALTALHGAVPRSSHPCEHSSARKLTTIVACVKQNGKGLHDCSKIYIDKVYRM